MAFYLGDVLVEKILNGIAEDKFDDSLLYTLPQLNTATINVTSTSTDINDKDGNLVKRVYSGKTGEFEAVNAFINTSIMGSQTGDGVTYASENAPITMLRTVVAKAGATVDIPDYVEGKVTVNAYDNDVVREAFTLGTSASATEFAINKSTKKLTLPSAEGVTQYFVKYYRTVKSGLRVRNTADSFPKAIRLTLKVLCADICNQVRLAYVTLPNFMVSPDVSIAFDKENQNMNYNGSLGIDYCSTDKELYTIDFAEDDED